MNRLREKWAEFIGLFREKYLLLLMFCLIILLTIPIDVVSRLLGMENQEETRALAYYVGNTPFWDLVFQLVVVAPLTQEFLYRGPARLLVALFPNMGEKSIIAWAIVVIPTYYWAAQLGGGHKFPMDAFFVGLVFGWSVLKTKNLESAMLLHMLYNAVNLIGALMKFRVL